MNPHFAEMLSALSAAGADYLVVGAFALSAHGHVRATGDIDIWIRPTRENAAHVMEAQAPFRSSRSRISPPTSEPPAAPRTLQISPGSNHN